MERFVLLLLALAGFASAANTAGNHAELDVDIRDEDVFGEEFALFILYCAVASIACCSCGIATRTYNNKLREAAAGAEDASQV
mmetsp:Transcript_4283/g.12480  ORF Transcript_4283/g.12480 Transcript_4283/m.12480 type:complete len:83 (+) Transcript_4283:144-392(+)